VLAKIGEGERIMSDGEANADLVRRFFETWGDGFEDMVAGFRAAMAQDCVLEQTKTPTVNGLDAIVSFLRSVRAAGVFETISVEIRELIATDRFVVAERTDLLRNAAGGVTSTLPCVGILEITGGKIISWRDYFDTGDMQTGGMAAAQAENW
jgi:limonene-1,2-epoxide hydrolase